MKPKDYLLKHGHITEITRGRLSKSNIEIIETAVRNGVDIEGYSVSKVQPKAPVERTDSTPAQPKVERITKDTGIEDLPAQVRSENDWQAFTSIEGERIPVGMRKVCNGCGNSLTYCYCRTAMVSIGEDDRCVVTYTHRSTPFVKAW